MENIILATITIIYIFFAYKMLFLLINEVNERKKFFLQLVLQIVSSFYGVYLGLTFIMKLAKRI